MKCPHCDQDVPGDPCPKCGITVPMDANYCMECGSLMDQTVEATDEEDELDLENRILCPDGTCTGIIVDGKCVECGKKHKEK